MKTSLKSRILFLFLLASLFASAQVPVLNSYPSSSNVIFLDFDGHVVEGTSWNASGPIACEASTLNASQITTVFNRVAEDYRPFTVNVTTDSTKYWAAPANHRMRVVLTVSSSWYGAAGGVAYINSFTWGDNTPCFVFTALLNNNVKNIAEATSHEAGHTLGLRHQSAYDAVCNKTSEYNAGKGSGEIGWAPIMGVGYYQNMTLWNYGANPFGCNSIQDDLSVITGNGNGITFRPDDFANTATGATAPAVANNAFTVSGIIEKPGDVDALKFTTATAGRFALEALPYSIGSGNTGSNIDLEVTLLNAQHAVVGVYNTAGTLSTAIDTALPAGTWYLLVEGKGNVYAPGYASLGSYTLNATLAADVNPLPVYSLKLKGTADSKQHNLTWEIVADEKIVSQTVEVASGANGYQPLTLPDATARSFGYAPASNSLLYYRLNVLFDNGRRYYSNVVALRNGNAGGKPTLVGNVTSGTLTVSSPGAFAYAVVDLTGRTLAQGTVAQGMNLLSPRLTANGLYLIRFENGAEHYTEKFTKQ